MEHGKPEKHKTGYTEGVAYAKGDGTYLPFKSSNKDMGRKQKFRSLAARRVARGGK